MLCSLNQIVIVRKGGNDWIFDGSQVSRNYG